MRVYRQEELEQRTDEWLSLKWGRMSASRIDRLTKSAKLDYIRGRAMEARRYPPLMEDQYLARAAQRGVESEPFALAAFLAKTGLPESTISCIEIGNHFILSPDYLSEDMTMGAEIKILEPDEMGKAVYVGKILAKHYWQVVSYFLVPELEIMSYVLYSPAIDNANGKDYIRIIELRRIDCLSDIARIEILISEAGQMIDILRLSDSND